MDNRILVLWATPRSTSTAFEWVMRMRGLPEMSTSGSRLDAAEARLSAKERDEEHAGVLERIRRGANGDPYHSPDGRASD